MDIRIRDFRPGDLEAAKHLFEVSFADEFRAEGLTVEAITAQLRLILRGQMVPFRLVAALARIVWGILVAEVEGQVVGVAAYYGRRDSVTLFALMVLPEYRRQGIGQALLIERLKRITRSGGKVALTSVLESNAASLNNLTKHGFAVFARQTEFDWQLPVANGASSNHSFTSRPLTQADRTLFEAFERDVIGATVVDRQGSDWPRIFPTWLTRLQRKMNGSHWQSFALEAAGRPVGYAYASIDVGASKGTVSILVVEKSSADLQLAMLNEIGAWVGGRGLFALRIAVYGDTPERLQELTNLSERQTFLSLMKCL